MTHGAPLAICINCKVKKIKKQDHRMCYQCNKKINPKLKKGKK